jgi:hypothetical protein
VNLEVLGLGPSQHGDGSLGGKSCKRNPAALISARSATTSTRPSASPGVIAASVHVIPGLPRTDIMGVEVEVRGGRSDSCRGDMSAPVRCFGHRPAARSRRVTQGSDGDTFGSCPVWFSERIIRDGWQLDALGRTDALEGAGR